MKKCKIVAFDKTGTLFTRINKIEETYFFQETYSKESLWEIVAVVEKSLRHPIAEILYKEAYQRSQVEGTNFSVLINKTSKIGKEGLEAEVLLKKEQKICSILLGNENLLKNNEI